MLGRATFPVDGAGNSTARGGARRAANPSIRGVFCADGTWNGPIGEDPAAVDTPSNVQLLFRGLAGRRLAPTLLRDARHCAAGIGTSRGWLDGGSRREATPDTGSLTFGLPSPARCCLRIQPIQNGQGLACVTA